MLKAACCITPRHKAQGESQGSRQPQVLRLKNVVCWVAYTQTLRLHALTTMMVSGPHPRSFFMKGTQTFSRAYRGSAPATYTDSV